MWAASQIWSYIIFGEFLIAIIEIEISSRLDKRVVILITKQHSHDQKASGSGCATPRHLSLQTAFHNLSLIALFRVVLAKLEPDIRTERTYFSLMFCERVS